MGFAMFYIAELTNSAGNVAYNKIEADSSIKARLVIERNLDTMRRINGVEVELTSLHTIH